MQSPNPCAHSGPSTPQQGSVAQVHAPMRCVVPDVVAGDREAFVVRGPHRIGEVLFRILVQERLAVFQCAVPRHACGIFVLRNEGVGTLSQRMTASRRADAIFQVVARAAVSGGAAEHLRGGGCADPARQLATSLCRNNNMQRVIALIGV